jgi:hypothetical protein
MGKLFLKPVALTTSCLICCLSLMAVLMVVTPSAVWGGQDSGIADQQKGNIVVALEPCGSIPQCGTEVRLVQESDPATGKLRTVERNICTCCQIVECGARIQAWRSGNWSGKWPRPEGCAFGSCPRTPNVYYFAPNIPRETETHLGGPRS